MKIGIVGLGLIGGSMARSIKARTEHTVYGADLDEETMEMAVMSGAIDGELDDITLPSCDIILIAIRPGAAVRWVEEHAGKISADTVVVDLCGVKRVVVEGIAPIAERYGFKYVGGHPMAGKELNGFVHSTPTLFQNASMILTPGGDAGLPLLEKLRDFFLSIGFARMTFTTPEEHDRVIAYTSQLAHISSSAYIMSPESQKQRGFSAGSFRDMTRLAKLDEDMWTELFFDNADFLEEQVDILTTHLQEFQRALHENDRDAMRELLKKGREMKESSARSGGTQ